MRFIYILIALNLFIIPTFAADYSLPKMDFIQNQGHFKHFDNSPANDILFKLNRENESIYLQKNGFSQVAFKSKSLPQNEIDFNIKQNPAPKIYESERIDFSFLNISPKMSISMQNENNSKSTIIKDSKTIKEKSYSSIIYKNLWDNIDFVIAKAYDGALEYKFILDEKSNPKDIKFRIENAKDISIDEKGNLNVKGDFAEFTHIKPTILLYESENVLLEEAEFEINGTSVGFNLQREIKGKAIIDPLVKTWSTYFGGQNDDASYGVAIDKDSNVVVCGFSESTNQIAKSGYQNELKGDADAFVAKFSPSGTLLWATYYGGNGYEIAWSLDCDKNGNIIVVGECSSDTLSLVSPFQSTYGGNLSDAFLLQFSPVGELKWATFYGGDGEDRLNDVKFDEFQNVYAVGYSSSTNNISAGGFQNDLKAKNDAFVIKFNPNFERVWASYLGGSQDDYARALSLDKNRNLYIAGSSDSPDLNTANGLFKYKGNLFDAFFAKVKNDGNLEFISYYGGESQDFGNDILVIDSVYYLAGSTQSENAIAQNGIRNTNSGYSDAFLVKFDSLDIKWGTYYGGNGNDFGYAIAQDLNSSVTLVGTSTSTDDIEWNGFQKFNSGSSDGLLANFMLDGNSHFSSYIGRNKVDDLRNCAIFDSKVIAVGFTNSTSGIAVNAHQDTLGGGLDSYIQGLKSIKIECSNETPIYCYKDTVSIKFQINDTTIIKTIRLSAFIQNQDNLTKGWESLGNPIAIKDNSILKYKINSDIQSASRYKLQIIDYTKGLYSNFTEEFALLGRIKLARTISNVCLNNTDYMEISENWLDSSKIHYKWEAENCKIIGSDSSRKTYFFFDKIGLVKINIIRKYEDCVDTLFFQITIKALPELVATAPDTVCLLSPIKFNITKNENVVYYWNFKSGEAKDISSDSFEYYAPQAGLYSFYISAYDLQTNCSTTVIKNVYVKEEKEAYISGASESCKNCEEDFQLFADNAQNIKWRIDNGSIIGRDDSSWVKIKFDISDNATLIVDFQDSTTGCPASKFIKIELNEKLKANYSSMNKLFCIKNDISFSTTNNPDISNFWSTSDGNVVSGQGTSSVKVRFNKEGIVSLKLLQINKVTNDKDSIVKNWTISPASIIPDIQGTRKNCIGDTMYLYSLSNNLIWKADNQNVIEMDMSSIKISLETLGKYVIYYYVKSSNSCDSDLDSIVYSVNPRLEKPLLTLSNDTLFVENGFYEWYLDGKLLTTTDGQTFLKISERGNYSVKRIDNNYACHSEISESIYFNPTSVEISEDYNFVIYPNPSDDFVNIKIPESAILTELKLYNSIGIEIENIEYETNNTSIRLETSSIKTGAYLLSIITQNRNYYIKFVISR